SWNATHGSTGKISIGPAQYLPDSTEFTASRVWADESGNNRVGAVLIQDQRIAATRDVQKADARPGGYTVTGGHGGIVGAVGHEGPPTLTYIPARRHTYQSQVNIARLPAKVLGVNRAGDKVAMTPVPIKNEAGELLGSAITT